jgi:hypothetical protein
VPQARAPAPTSHPRPRLETARPARRNTHHLGGEIGRTPLRQGADGDGKKTAAGRDHHKDAYTMRLAGGGVKPGITYGKTDDLGFNIAANPVHTHDLNATLLHLLGLDHQRLTYRYQGRDYRLTDVSGKLVPGIIA